MEQWESQSNIQPIWHLAREEVSAKSSEATAAVARVERASKDMKMAEIDTLRDRLSVGMKKTPNTQPNNLVYRR
jgi:hypothetical protein